MLNPIAGSVGLLVQFALLLGTYLLVAPRRGRSLALLFALLVAIDGYALLLLGMMVLGVPWQVTNLFAVVVLGASLASRRLRAAMARPSSQARRLLASHWGALGIVAVAVAIQVVVVVVTPELSIDGQLYHGPTLAQIVQHGTVWGWQAPNQYMYYTDLTMVGGVNLATFTGGTVFDNGLQIPHLVILIAAIVMALRSRFASSWHRAAFAVLLVTAPVIWLQPRILYVDVAYGAAVAAMILLIVLNRKTAPVDVLVAGIAGATIIATKPAGALTGVLLLAVFTVMTIVRVVRLPAAARPHVWVIVIAFATPIALAAGFYVRNLVSFSNPIYPVVASLGGLKLPGIIDFSVFASGSRGSGLVDPTRLQTFLESLVTGATSGVIKPDYDPRAGGYGYLPWFVMGIVFLILLGQVIWRLRARPILWTGTSTWLRQLALVAIAAAVLLIQPSAFDSRYVIGPTVVVFVAILMTSLVRDVPALPDILAAALALVLAAGQVAWTEYYAYPGVKAISGLRNLSSEWQPSTPGNPWGRSDAVSWLPRDAGRCVTIALQTDGGVAAGGMREASAWGTLPYGLYGEALCNEVLPVQIAAYEGAALLRDSRFSAADYLVLYSQDVPRWQRLVPDADRCWVQVGVLPGTETYPQDETVFRNLCS